MSARHKHRVCAPGAAVRLHGYAPARVLRLEYVRGAWHADCVITSRNPGKIGPHGYRSDERVTVIASEAVPRDVIRVSRQRPGALWWPSFLVMDHKLGTLGYAPGGVA